MKWSQLPRRKRQLYVGVGVLVVAVLFALSAVNRNKQQVGADVAGDGIPALDSVTVDTAKLVRVKTTDSAGTAKAAFLDAFTLDSQEGLVGETAANGEGTLRLNDQSCYAIRATDQASDAEKTVIVAVGLTPSQCDATAVAAPEATEPLTISMQ